MVSKKYQNSKCEREFLNFFHARAGGNLPLLRATGGVSGIYNTEKIRNIKYYMMNHVDVDNC
ncbi:MAG: hypothetical protein UX74_C0007G0035 [Parcubacteria group bacterium GW2011_GWA2_47_10b]|nr:MAG: hypothetical protein UX74_C0007G0035 [Parcubacteria group bacterium GW2011_GWA2_47_10b]